VCGSSLSHHGQTSLVVLGEEERDVDNGVFVDKGSVCGGRESETIMVLFLWNIQCIKRKKERERKGMEERKSKKNEIKQH